MLAFKAFKNAAAYDGLGKSISFPAVGTAVALADGSGDGLVSPALCAKLVSASLDKFRSKHVPATLFWCTKNCATHAAFEIEINSAKPSVAYHHYLIAELEFAHRVANLLYNKDVAQGGLAEADGEVFTSWLANLMPIAEVHKCLYRPWNPEGIKGFKCADDDFTPQVFSPANSAQGGDSAGMGVGAGAGALGAAHQGAQPLPPFDPLGSVLGRFFGSDHAYTQFCSKDCSGRIEMIFGYPLALWTQPASIDNLIKLCATRLPDRVGSEAGKYFSLSANMGSVQMSGETLAYRRQSSLAALIKDVRPDSRNALIGAMHAFASVMSCSARSAFLGLSPSVAMTTSSFIHATAVAITDMLHWEDASLRLTLEEIYSFLASIMIERVIVPAYRTNDDAAAIEAIIAVSTPAELKEHLLQFRTASRTSGGHRQQAASKRAGGFAAGSASEDSTSSSDETSGHDRHSSSSSASRSGSKSSSGSNPAPKRGKSSGKPCFYFNETSCQSGEKCAFEHVCSFCLSKNRKSHAHARTQCEVQKRANDKVFKTPNPKDASHL
jgi:hypothetical protein